MIRVHLELRDEGMIYYTEVKKYIKDQEFIVYMNARFSKCLHISIFYFLAISLICQNHIFAHCIY